MSVQTCLFTLRGTALAVALTAVAVAPVARADVLAVSVRPAVAPMAQAALSTALAVALDRQTPYEAQVSCDPRSKPGVTAFTALMRARYRTGGFGTYRPCQRDTSEHYDSRALDWMLSVNNPRQKLIANWVAATLSAHNGVLARRYGISYIIWNHRMWREYAPARGWALYTGAVPHTDHMHFTFSWDGAMKRTSAWTGRATTVVDLGPCRVFTGQFAPLYRTRRTLPCPTRLLSAPVSSFRVAVYGQRSAQIALAQRVLRLSSTGSFDGVLFRKLITWQTAVHVPVTGALDKATWVRLVRR